MEHSYCLSFLVSKSAKDEERVYIKAKSFTTDQELRTAGILSICDLIAYTVESERPEAIDSNSPTDLGSISPWKIYIGQTVFYSRLFQCTLHI